MNKHFAAFVLSAGILTSSSALLAMMPEATPHQVHLNLGEYLYNPEIEFSQIFSLKIAREIGEQLKEYHQREEGI